MLSNIYPKSPANSKKLTHTRSQSSYVATLLKALRLKSSEKHELRQPGKQSSSVFNKIFISLMSLLSNEATKNKNTHWKVFNISSLSKVAHITFQ